jgi:hypothetical protein
MERSERLSLIKKIGVRLAEESYTDAGLALRTYEFSAPGFDPNYEDAYNYVVEQLEQGSDAQLAEIHRHFFPDDADLAADDDERGNWSAGMFRLFISHTHALRGPAARLSDQLRPWGVDAFVAHDAIEPTRRWQEEIESALRTCDALAPFLSSDFVESRWCDQEVGFAVSRRVLIVPVKIGVDPYGFIGQYQAITVSPEPNSTTPYKVAHAVFDALARSSWTAGAMSPAIVQRYANSESHDNTRDVFPLLQTISTANWTAQMVEEIRRAADVNSQVRDAVLPGGRKAPSAVEELLSGMGDLFSRPLTPVAGPGDDDIPF